MQATRVGGTTTLALVAALLASWAVAAHAEITSVAPSFELTYDVKFAGATAAAATVSTAPNAFTVRFGLNLYHYGLGPEGHPDDYANGRYTTAFTVLGSGNYDLTVTVHRVGELRREHLDPFVVSCGVDLAAMSAPLLTFNAVEPGPVLDQLTLPGASIPLGSDDVAVELSEGVRSQTISLRNRPTRDDVSLLFEMAAHATVNTLACEVSSRLGSQAVGSDTTLCPTCGYPGTGNRDINQDGLFVEVEVQDLCGNGGTNPGEECDLGNLNGTAGSCCTATCKFRPQGQTCRPANGDCDQAEVCSGTDRGCPVDLKKPASTVCRAAAPGGCDVAETCSGSEDACPLDVKLGDGTLCRPADPDALGCDVAEVCDGGVCQPDAKAAPGTTCQADANPCTNERCDASGQCAHVPVAPAGTFCDDGLFCNGEDRCDAAGVCGTHLNAPCSGTETCNEFGDECLIRPPLVVTNAGDVGEGTLSNAMAAANLRGGADTISFDPVFFATPRRITLGSALPTINGDLLISGPGAGLLTVDGDGVDRVFDVNGGVSATLSGMTITGGNAGNGAGGGIRNAGALSVVGCHVTGNTAAFGGGISNELGASLTVQQSTISRNTATGNATAGGIASTSDVTIANSTISGNRAVGAGGDNGGGLRLASATIENSTITDNAVAGPDSAGGLFINVGTVTLRNSIVAANADDATVADVAGSGSLSSGGYNLVGNPGGFPVSGTNDQKGAPGAPLDPQLAPLADNGGGTPTHAVRVASPALDRGNRFGAVADQRGATRPFDVTSIAGPGDQSDVGAVEMQAVIVTNAADSGAGSLRQAIADAPAGADVLFDPAFFAVPRSIALATEIGIAKNLTIHGPGADLLTLSGEGRNRVFRVAAGGLRVAMSGLTITGGFAADVGGGILSDGDLTMTACAIANNRVAGTAGGGVAVRGATGTFTGCTFSDNSSGFRGGALELDSASGSLTNCTVSGNRAGGFGGGGGISFINTTGERVLAIESSTIVDNSGANAAGVRVAAANATAIVTVRSSIIADNAGPGLSASPGAGGTATITSLGYNLSSDDGGGFLADDTDQTGTDPDLGPLQYNGGPTLTHMVRPGSPAIDQGNSAGLATDQRGRARPFDVAGVAAVPGGDNADVGAVETHTAIVTNDSGADPGSLRQVIAAAGPDADVWFDPAFFATERIIFLTGEILIGDDLTIHGPAAHLIVSGSGSSRVFNIASGVSVAINDLGMRDGESSPSGGVIASGGDLALTRCAVESGQTDGQGGGVFLTGAVGRFTDSLIAFNHAAFRGAGIGLDGASATLVNCTVSDNVAPSFGGGISLFTSTSDQTLAVTNCTFAANTAGDGADIRVEAFPTLSATATLRNTILAGANPTLRVLAATDATATITSLGYNLSTDAAAGLLDDNTDRINTNPLIAGPHDNGGATFTYALLPGSPAIDQGSSSGSHTDQRGAPRPIDDPAVPNASGGDGADIGAFELALPQATPTATATSTGSATAVSDSTPTATATGTPPTATATRSGSPAVGTPTATRSGSPSLETPTPTPTATPLGGTCIGDCDADGEVTISELVLAVNIALGNRPTAECTAADGNADGSVKISELITAVLNALGSCPQ